MQYVLTGRGKICNFFLADREKKWLEQFPIPFKPVSYFRCVEDTLTVFDIPDHATNFSCYLNQQYANFTFTPKPQSNGTLPFLNSLICKQNNKLSISIYRKQTFTGLGTSFYCNKSRTFKSSAIKTPRT